MMFFLLLFLISNLKMFDLKLNCHFMFYHCIFEQFIDLPVINFHLYGPSAAFALLAPASYLACMLYLLFPIYLMQARG